MLLHSPVVPEKVIETGWPPDVELILSAIRAGEQSQPNRRDHERAAYQVRAQLRLFSDLPGQGPWSLYTRDVNSRGLGFLTPHRLPLGYGGWIELPAPDGRLMKIHCTLFRCHERVKGWFEGALYFNRPQRRFDTQGSGQDRLEGYD